MGTWLVLRLWSRAGLSRPLFQPKSIVIASRLPASKPRWYYVVDIIITRVARASLPPFLLPFNNSTRASFVAQRALSLSFCDCGAVARRFPLPTVILRQPPRPISFHLDRIQLRLTQGLGFLSSHLQALQTQTHNRAPILNSTVACSSRLISQQPVHFRKHPFLAGQNWDFNYS